MQQQQMQMQRQREIESQVRDLAKLTLEELKGGDVERMRQEQEMAKEQRYQSEMKIDLAKDWEQKSIVDAMNDPSGFNFKKLKPKKKEEKAEKFTPVKLGDDFIDPYAIAYELETGKNN